MSRRTKVIPRVRTREREDQQGATTSGGLLGGGLPFSTSGALDAAASAVIEASKGTEDVRIDGPENDGKTLVSIDESREGVVDREDGLPATYDRIAIQRYWDGRPGELRKRWGEFVRLNVPFLTRIAGILLSGASLADESGPLSRQARKIMETLGPTYIKMGQMLSVRPDVLPEDARDELAVLQDSVKPFSSETAREVVERSLGVPIEDVFSSFSKEPIAAASLAQVHRATLASTGQEVAVKVQRPDIISTVSKDLYVLRRAAEVYQGIMDRFAPQQRTNYVGLLNEWAVGFYTELDFMNEAANQIKMRDLLRGAGVDDVYIPEVYLEHCSRYLLVTEWVEGKKLTECDPDEVNELVAIGQEAFLTQLLQLGFFHCDPHPGNLMKLHDESKGKLALIDFGLMASLNQEEMDTLVSSIVHLSNKDYAKLTEDFVKLDILPADCDRQKVLPLMDKALSPFIKGGGATKYKDEVLKIYEGAGGLQSMTSDFVTVMNDIPFSIPPYFALLGRAVATLEGIALVGDPNYRIVMESYPFVSRRLLSDDRPAFQQALTEILYSSPSSSSSSPRSASSFSLSFSILTSLSFSLSPSTHWPKQPRAEACGSAERSAGHRRGDGLLRRPRHPAGGIIEHEGFCILVLLPEGLWPEKKPEARVRERGRLSAEAGHQEGQHPGGGLCPAAPLHAQAGGRPGPLLHSGGGRFRFRSKNPEGGHRANCAAPHPRRGDLRAEHAGPAQ